MALLKVEAEKLSNNQLIQGVVEEIIEKDPMFSLLPFVRVNGKAYVYNREDIGASNNITSGTGLPTFLNVSDTIVEGAVPFKTITSMLRILAGDVQIDKFLQEVDGDTNDQMGVQIASKAKAVGRLYHNALVNGDASINAGISFDGLKALSTNADSNSGQSIQALTAGSPTNGGPLTFTQLDNLLDLIPNGADAIVMRRGTIRAFRSAVRLQGGSTGSEVIINEFGQPMLAHNGMPILINDFLPLEVTGAASTCSVYAVRLNEVDGLHGLYGGANAGLRVEAVGTHQTKDADIVRLKWYAGLVLKSSKSLARLSGITNV